MPVALRWPKGCKLKRFLPYILLAAGLVIIAVVAFLLLQGSLGAVSSAGAPSQLAGFALTEQTSGAAAITEIRNLHLVGNFEMQDAHVAVYGAQNMVLWIADAGAESTAQSQLVAMDDAIINAANSPFTMIGMYVFSGRQVRSLDGLGQLHFYFQSGSKVVWVSSDPGFAEQALQEALNFYP